MGPQRRNVCDHLDCVGISEGGLLGCHRSISSLANIAEGVLV